MSENEKIEDYESVPIKKIVKKGILFLILIMAVVVNLLFIKKEKEDEHHKQQKIAKAQAENEELEDRITSLKNAIDYLQKQYNVEIDRQVNVMLFFENFGESAYMSVIEEMDKYGFSGIIVFKDGNTPGMPGSISVELYQELLDKGWEGAIANSDEIVIYDNYPDVMKKKWTAYMREMIGSFEKYGLETPHIYVANENEAVDEIYENMKETGMDSYVTNLYSAEEIVEKTDNSNIANIGSIIGKYTYETLGEDVSVLRAKGYSMSLLFKKVENGAPKNETNTSLYMLKQHLRLLAELSDYVKVTTVSGYNDYENTLFSENQNTMEDYNHRIETLNEKVKQYEKEILERYAEIFGS